jgi:phenylalanyl-tRNA synthetase beta chain
MIISVNWLKEYTKIDTPIDELATLIGARLVEIEETINYGAKYAGVVVAKVVEARAVEDSDHLNVTKLDDGGVTQNVERDENGYVQVICGAPNVREGILVAWLPPNTIVPETAGDAEPFVLGARKLRGYMSNGMIASARELALFDEHEGILEVDADVAPGTAFADAYDLNDYLLDIENKSLTHRPDTFGVVGFAREVAAIQGNAFTTPEWLREDQVNYGEKQSREIQNPTVVIDDPALSSRYQGVVLSGVDGSVKSPLPLQTYLARVGVRPISAVVDTTNYLMLAAGQPLHAFDYEKLAAVNNGKIEIHVRAGRKDETLALLDGRTIELSESDIVIANGEKAVALAGAMGGAETEIDDNTKTIFLESATFNLYNLRATQMRHGIFSEAITRLTKGQPGALTAPALAHAISLMTKHVGAVRVSDVVEDFPGKKDPIQITLSSSKINDVLGTQLTSEMITTTMRNVEFDATENGDELTFTVPYWRGDIHIDEDIIEEVGRLNGFDSITPTLAKRDFTAVRPSGFDQTRADIRRALVRAGANEVLTYSFVHGDLLEKANQKTEDSYRIVNSISPDLQYYRQTLTPSLLAAVHQNIKQGYESFALFEVNKAHPKQHGMTDENVPAEVDMVALTLASKKKQSGAAYFHARKMLDYLGSSLGLDLIYSPIEADPNYPVTAPFEHRRSALVTDKKTDTFIGIVGEYKRSVARSFKLPEYSAGFEIGSPALLEAVKKLTSAYKPVSRYPSTERDICFQVASSVAYRDITDAITLALADVDLETLCIPLDIYQSENDNTTKNITVRIKLTPHDRTLTGEEATMVMKKVTDEVVGATNAKVI